MSNEPTYQIEAIGPQEATALLEMNTNNRRMVNRAVTEYANAMENGDWKFDGAPIRLSDEGVILDGQHRLSAIVASGTTQKMLVIYGLDKETQLVMDTGRKRTLANALSLRGEKESGLLAATVSLDWRWINGLRGKRLFSSGGIATESNADVLLPQISQLLTHLDNTPRIREAIKPALNVARHVPLPPRIGALLFLLTSEIDENDAKYFFEKLVSGSDLEDENPILVLRNRLLEAGRERRVRGASLDLNTTLAYCIKSWNVYRDGGSMKRLLFKQGGAFPDKFPEPR